VNELGARLEKLPRDRQEQLEQGLPNSTRGSCAAINFSGKGPGPQKGTKERPQPVMWSVYTLLRFARPINSGIASYLVRH
jgi:hypothetical protein